MSIIMMAGSAQENPRSQHRSQQFAPGIKELLDHIAVELAAEYVRLMDATAQASQHSPTHSD